MVQFEITMICLQARCQATVQAALFVARPARTGVLSLSKTDDSHQLDLEDRPQRNVGALSIQPRLFHKILRPSRKQADRFVNLGYRFREQWR
jgi:hypothetical protein